MRSQTINLDIPASNGDGDPTDISRFFQDRSIQFIGVNGTLQVHISNDGVNFKQFGSNISSDGFVALTTPAHYVRITRTGGNGSTDQAIFFGFDSRSN